MSVAGTRICIPRYPCFNVLGEQMLLEFFTGRVYAFKIFRQLVVGDQGKRNAGENNRMMFGKPDSRAGQAVELFSRSDVSRHHVLVADDRR